MASSLEEVVVVVDLDESTDQPHSPLLPSTGGDSSNGKSPCDVVSTLDWFRNVFNTAATYDQTLSMNEWKLALQYPVSMHVHYIVPMQPMTLYHGNISMIPYTSIHI